MRGWLSPLAYQGASMNGSIFVALALGAVLLILLAGLVVMIRGGRPNLSNRLMRLRVVAQLIAIIIIMLVLYINGH
jgi:hypothetical protein